MAILTKAELLASFPDNTGGDISAENLRNFVNSNLSLEFLTISSTPVTVAETTDIIIGINGAGTVNLPAIVSFKDRALVITNDSTISTMTIDPDGAETINLQSSLVMSPGRVVVIYSELGSTDWNIIINNLGQFINLEDTPSSYSGASLQGVRVNTGETALEFFDVFDIQQATATGSTTESSATFQVISGMTITPGAGSYLVWFSGSWENDSNNRVIFLAIFENGVEVAQSEVRLDIRNADVPMPVSTHALITGLGDSQDIDIRWSADGTGTRTMHERTLTILKVAE